jgi:hypothetical protein
LAVKVLAFSIRRHTAMQVDVDSLESVKLPEGGAFNSSRTGFSFARFAIPELAGRHGRAIYLDADMLVFKDIEQLWSLPFDGAKVLLQEEPKMSAVNGGKKRIKQTAVMVLDCAALDWDAPEIVRGVGQKYTYEQLMQQLCILPPQEISHTVPHYWNSQERYDHDVALLHFTDMLTQPWVSPRNENGWRWTNEVRLMLESGALEWPEIDEEVRLGHFRPSLLTELREMPSGTPLPKEMIDKFSNEDAAAGYVAHRHLSRHTSPVARIRRSIGGLMRQVGLR